MSTSVKHIHSGMRGAPQISGTPGTLIAALDALFISGWGVTTALSVTVAGGVATAQLTPGDTFDRDAVVLVAGATPGALNGEARVASSSNTSISWATTAPDGVATGTITIKYAPQTSWVKVFAGTNKAVYRSSHPQSAGHYLRVDDTGTTTARVRGFESMSDVDTGVGPFPTEAIMAGGGYWHKSITANATAIRYRIFADERFVIIAIGAGSATPANKNAPARGFGDPIALAPGGDVWATVLSFNGSGSSAVGDASFTNPNTGGATGNTVAARAFSGLGGAVAMINEPFTGGAISGVTATLGAFPSEVDGQLKLSKMFTHEVGTGKPPRAVIPGVLFIPQSGAWGPLSDGDILTGAGDMAGRRLMVVPDPGNNSWGNSTAACYLVDITGPWR
jgi:hypothetical protein